jgi:hypothetical protein
MRFSQLGLIVVGLMVGSTPFMACKGSNGTTSGAGGQEATGGGSGGLAAGTGGQGGGGASGAGGVTAGGGGAGRSAVRYCFPPCIANLRKTCERPSLDGGTCISTGTTKCYSNGIREIQAIVDAGGAIITFTEPDGQTPCYKVAIDDTGAIDTYETTDGQQVAVLMIVGPDTYTVTCDGTTTTVDTSSQACATLTESSCTSATTCSP